MCAPDFTGPWITEGPLERPRPRRRAGRRSRPPRPDPAPDRRGRGDLAWASRGGDAAAAQALTDQGSHQMNHEGGGVILATLEAHRQVTG